ncbi:uncharacterized protein LOC129582471, partial [Paramacrobiotus metropolitanus]|uniref:uncharacterized protein LOC129582471 n=1 Tax=Paramacrobiotus metropolitanus TaxID=2943436 RepID=UPI0024462FBA
RSCHGQYNGKRHADRGVLPGAPLLVRPDLRPPDPRGPGHHPPLNRHVPPRPITHRLRDPHRPLPAAPPAHVLPPGAPQQHHLLPPAPPPPLTLPCPFIYFLYVLNYSLIAWADAALALNRFTAILLPHHYPRVASRRAVVLQLAVCWTIALGCALPQYLSPRIQVALLPSGACNIVRSEGRLLFMLVLLSLYVPLGAVGFLYSFVFLSRYCKVCRNRVMGLNGIVDAVFVEKMQRRIATAKILFYSFIWYCVCFIPLSFIPLLLAVPLNSDIRILLCTKTVFYLAFAAEPAFFYAMSGQYRREARNILIQLWQWLVCRRVRFRKNAPSPEKTVDLNESRLTLTRPTAYFRSGFDVSRY